MPTKRLQLDLTIEDHDLLDRLLVQSALKTKGELLSQALALFQWAAAEALHGNVIASLSATGETVNKADIPSIRALGSVRAVLDALSPTEEELRERTRQPGISADLVLAEMKKHLERTDEQLASPVFESSLQSARQVV